MSTYNFWGSTLSSVSESGSSASTTMSMRSTISLNRTPTEAGGGSGGGGGGIESFSNVRFKRSIKARDSSDCRESSVVSIQNIFFIAFRIFIVE